MEAVREFFVGNMPWTAAGAALVLVLIVLLILIAARRRKRAAEPQPESVEAEAIEARAEVEKAEEAGVEQPQPEAEVERAEVEAEQVVEVEKEPEPSPEERAKGLFARLARGLSKTKTALVGRIESLFTGRKVDDELFEELEEILITGDVGVRTTEELLDALRRRVKEERIVEAEALKSVLKEEVRKRLQPGPVSIELSSRPFVIMMVGVNGVGKTTTIGKIASGFVRAGKKVILAASDTFRAAAVEQLEKWAERSGADIVKQSSGADPAAVAFDAVSAAVARGADVVIIDTAGRLHTKKNLMEEMKKIKRVAGKALDGAPHMVLLVVDANTGQNAIRQAEEFNEAVGIDGIILTKLDGTAKGGVIISVYDQLKIPIYYVGVGEKVDDLRPFDPDEFVRALFE